MTETAVQVLVERVDELKGADRPDLCDAAEAAIRDGGGFGWLSPPPRHVLETFWQGVLLVPERTLFVARLDGVIGGSAQLVRPTRNNEAQAHAANLTTSFVAPWARGHGLARALVLAVEDAAQKEGFAVINLDVRETQRAAIVLYERLGYEHWGTNPYYARVGGKWIAGHFYSKVINPGLIAEGA
jgi:ribosomal protein S18 acetylase RimI-like enzyme